MFSTKIGLDLLFTLIIFNLIWFIISKKTIKKPKLNTYSFFIIWLFYALGQMLFVMKVPKTMNNLQIFVVGIILISFMSLIIKKYSDLLYLYKAWGVAILATIIVGWWEIITEKHLPQSGADFYFYENVATAGFYNPNDYAFYLSLGLPIILYWIKLKGLYKILGLFMFISSFYFMYANEARFILAIFFLVLLLYYLKLIKERKIKLFLFITTVILTSVYYLNQTIKESFESIFSITGNDTSVNVREFLTSEAIKIFKQNIFGVGTGNAELYMPRIGVGSSVHNFWIEILLNYGLFIFVGLIIFFIVSVYLLFKVNHQELKEKLFPVKWSILIFIPTCIQSSSIFTFGITWFFFGVMVCAVNVRNNEKTLYSKSQSIKATKHKSSTEQTVS